MATREELYTALRNADAAGDSDSVRKLGAYLKSMDAPSVLDRTNADVTVDQARAKEAGSMSGLGQFAAGYGSAIPRMVRGAGQRMGVVSQASADEANARDKPLLDTFWGGLGNTAGSVMGAAIPALMAPEAGTLGGAAMLGGALGYIQPTSTGESPDKNAAIGAVAGPAGVVAGRTLGAAYQGGKALVEPFYEAGRNRIGGRVLQRFAEDPSKIAGATNTPTITGALPDLAEQTGDRGIAQLRDVLRSSDPRFANALEARARENNAARVGNLRTLAGENGPMDAAVSAREAAAKQQYADAFKNSAALSPSQVKAQSDLLGSGKIATLLETPAIADAREAAKKIASNFGTPINDPAGSVQGLHYMKLAMDDAIAVAKNKNTTAGDNLAASIKSAQVRLVDALETISPSYKTARTTYAQNSRPINSMETVAHINKSNALSSGSDLSGNPTINRNGLMAQLKDERALVKDATGRPLGSLSDVMEPQDLNMLRTIASEADRAGAVNTAGIGKGSPTNQRFTSQNILSQAIGPTGLPPSWAESVLARTAAKPLNLLYGGVAEPKIQQALAEALLDPAKAQAMIAAAAPSQKPLLAKLFQQAAAARAVPVANGLANRP